MSQFTETESKGAERHDPTAFAAESAGEKAVGTTAGTFSVPSAITPANSA